MKLIWVVGIFVLILSSAIVSSRISVFVKSEQSITPLEAQMQLLGAGSKWAANGGTSALYVNWYDNVIAHPTPWLNDTSLVFPRRGWITQALEEYGLNVTFAADIPNDLSEYAVVIIDAWWACEPSNASVIQNYIDNGGGVVLMGGVPCYFAVYCKDYWPDGPGSDLSGIQDWFGASHFTNAGGYAHMSADKPFGTSLSVGDVVFEPYADDDAPWSHSAVGSLSGNSQVISTWDNGLVLSFTHTYGSGRLYYQAEPHFHDYVSAPALISTSISISTRSPSTAPGYVVHINGSLHDYLGTGLADKWILIYYTFPGASAWTAITSCSTDDNGDYLVDWISPATGYFTLKAEWAGNATHAEASNMVTLSSLPYEDKYFSVESNSTISALAFNSTTSELSFTASGPTGTTGYVKVTIAKSLIQDVSSLKVYLDEQQLNYSASSTDDSWLLTFTYSHSSHRITIGTIKTIPEYGILNPALLLLATGLATALILRNPKRIRIPRANC